METPEHVAEPPLQQQQDSGFLGHDKELQSFIRSQDAPLKSESNMDSLGLTTPRSVEQPQESTSGIETTAKKRGRPKKSASLAPPLHDERSQDSTALTAAPAKRRGRPKKHVAFEMAEVAKGSADEQGQGASYVEAPVKARGRPKKRVTDDMAQMETASADEAGEIATREQSQAQKLIGADAGYILTPKEQKARTKTPARPKKLDTYGMARLNSASAEEGDGHAAQKEEQGPELYVRPIARYVAPPKQGKPPGLRSIYFAFQAEKDVGEEDPFSAYAFGGPRHREPFRMLQDIGDPNEKDISGWAENLRWAREQWKFFPDAVGNTGWNESPEQMEMIAEIRDQQFWLSDELVAHLEKPEKKSKKVKKKVWNDEMEE